MDHITFKDNSNTTCYFDSGYSKHMTWNHSLFKTFEEYIEGTITFDDCKTSKNVGKGSVKIEDIPKLDKVLCMETLKENLISIS